MIPSRLRLPANALAAAALATSLLTGTAAAVAAPQPARGSEGATTSGSGGATPVGPSAATRSAPVRERARSSEPGAPASMAGRVDPRAGAGGSGSTGAAARGRARRDPLIGAAVEGDSPEPTLVFDGTGNPLGCGTCAPPDPTGDVGPNHYVQMVNSTKVAVFDRAGTLLAPAFDLSVLFPSGDCSTIDWGDPQVAYDPLADRWVLSQFRNAPYGLCFAVSQTPDPLGDYFLYSFDTTEFPDYFKLGVWPTGYYVSTSEYSGYAVYAFDRTRMLLGQTATAVRVDNAAPNFLLPADVDGTEPPAASGGLFYTFLDDDFHGGSDRVVLLRLTPDFTTPADTTLSTVDSFPIAPFTYTVCGFFTLNCIPQGGTTQEVDAVSEWPMQRLAYRRLADRETLVGTFTVGGGTGPAGAAVRWFELSDPGSGWSLQQEGTQDLGDGLDRWLGSIAMDANGNIALGYSASSTTEFPSIRYAVRAPSDPPGSLRGERVMKAGGGSQTRSSRWGDYSAMSVDAGDERGFWYTNEYYATSSPVGWSTSIGTFTVMWPQAIDFPQPPDAVFGAPVAVSATGGGSGNPVTFESATPSVCTTGGPDGTIVTLRTVGTCTLTAKQAGDSSYDPAPQVQRSFQVTPARQAIDFPQPPDTPLAAGTLVVSATGGGSGNPVTFASVTPSVCTTGGPDGTTVTLQTVGTCTLTADQAGTTTYAAAPQVQRSLQVTPSATRRQRPVTPLGLPSRVRPVGTTRLLSLPVTTNAGQVARVSAVCGPRPLGARPGGDSGRVCRIIRTRSRLAVRVSGDRGVVVRIRISAPAVTGYSAYERTVVYRTRPVQ